MSKRFLYLVQTATELPESYRTIVGPDADLVLLTFKTPHPDAIFLPKSSWTAGRNRLVAEALARIDDYEYFIFLDDDVQFIQGDWRAFEAGVMKYRPAIATPFCPWYHNGNPPGKGTANSEAQQCYWYDAIYNAFHRDVLRDRILLPYHEGFDDKSWWYSQYFVIELTALLYRGQVLQINTVSIDNGAHSPYPQSFEFKGVRRWMDKVVRRQTLVGALSRSRIFDVDRAIRKRLGMPKGPAPALASYRLDAERVRRVLRDRADNPFWRQFIEAREQSAIPAPTQR